MTDYKDGQWLINLSQKERFVNATSEIFEGEFHPANFKLVCVGEYSKSVESGDLPETIIYDIAHEKELQRMAMFSHFIQPFWAGYDKDHTTLKDSEKFLIFLKILREVKHVYPVDVLEEIYYAMIAQLDLNENETQRLAEGKMWHNYFLKEYEAYAISKLRSDSKGFYV